MRTTTTAALMTALITVSACATSGVDDATVVTCRYDGYPTAVLTYRGGMGAADNTVSIGGSPPVPLSVGSSMSLADYQGQELSFYVRDPASLTVTRGVSSNTYSGNCSSTLPR